MSLSRNLFVEWWLVLCRRFNRDWSKDDPIDKRVASRYYRALDGLSDEAFERACDHAFTHNTYFPKPYELLHVGQDVDRRIEHEGVREQMQKIDAEEKRRIEEEADRLYPAFRDRKRIVGTVLENPPTTGDDA